MAELFSNLFKKNKKNKIISASELAVEEEISLKNNLRIIKNYNDLIGDKYSIYKIPFFNFNINDKTEPVVNKLLNLIDEIYDFFSPDHGRIAYDEDRYNLSQYSGELKIISEVNTRLKYLSENNVYLYSGELRNVPIISIDLNENLETVESGGPYPDIIKNFNTSVKVEKKDFNIYNFVNSFSGNYIEAIYKPSFSFFELENIIKKNPFIKTYTTEQDSFEIKINFENEAKKDASIFYSKIFEKKYEFDSILPFNFERSKIEFRNEKNKYDNRDYKKGIDPFFDEYLEKNNLTYEEAMEAAEDYYGQMMTDIKRGK